MLIKRKSLNYQIWCSMNNINENRQIGSNSFLPLKNLETQSVVDGPLHVLLLFRLTIEETIKFIVTWNYWTMTTGLSIVITCRAKIYCKIINLLNVHCIPLWTLPSNYKIERKRLEDRFSNALQIKSMASSFIYMYIWIIDCKIDQIEFSFEIGVHLF